MAPFYKLVAAELKWSVDASLLKTLTEANELKLKQLDEKIADAEANLGETEITDSLIAKAEYLAKIGEKVNKWNALDHGMERRSAPLPSRHSWIWSTEL